MASSRYLNRYGMPMYVYPLMIIFVVLFAFCTEYDSTQAGPVITSKTIDDKVIHLRQPIPTTSDNPLSTYAMYMDATAMCVLGFGFLYAFSKYYVWSGIGFNFLICGFCFLWVCICSCFINSGFEGHLVRTKINLETMVGSNLVTAAVLISFGAIYGFITPTQLCLVCLIEPFFMKLNEHLVVHYMHVQDAGGSLVTHTFGAYFGVAMVFGLGIKKNDLRDQFRSTTYFSDMGAMVGSIVLWIFWPSFNGALLYNDSTLQGRVVINTYLAISASCVTAFVTSGAAHKGRMEMLEIQNATLAGGVTIGMISSFQIQPWSAVLIGAIGGVVSTFGYSHLHPWLEEHGIVDSAGVQMLHGIPGILGTLAAAFSVLMDNFNYMYSYNTAWKSTAESSRSRAAQFGYIIAATVITMVISIAVGIVTGMLMRTPCLPRVHKDDMLIDHDFWYIHDRHADPRKHRPNVNGSKNQTNIITSRVSTVMGTDGIVMSNLNYQKELGPAGRISVAGKNSYTIKEGEEE